MLHHRVARAMLLCPGLIMRYRARQSCEEALDVTGARFSAVDDVWERIRFSKKCNRWEHGYFGVLRTRYTLDMCLLEVSNQTLRAHPGKPQRMCRQASIYCVAKSLIAGIRGYWLLTGFLRSIGVGCVVRFRRSVVFFLDIDVDAAYGGIGN